jgi:alkaline phosphatase
VLGGGRRHFLPAGSGSSRSDSRNLIDEMKARGYVYAANQAELNAVGNSSEKVLGLFHASDMSYELDRDPGVEPSLSQMTAKAIDLLAAKNKGFFLMVEGGRIDHALHAANAQRALGDGIAFDDAIEVALDKMRALDPGLKNTLIVVTADHDHTLVLNGYAQRTGPTTATHPGVLGVVRSYVNGPGQGQPLKDIDGNAYTNIGFGNGPNRQAVRSPLVEATTADKAYLQESTIRLSSETHGGADVFLGAIGLGADHFHGVIDNTEVFGKIKLALGL